MSTFVRRRQSRAVLLIALSLTLLTTACGDDEAEPTDESGSTPWPTGTVTVVVGAAAGTANDLTARAVADFMATETGETFVVENRTAGSGADGMAMVASQPEDGLTIGLWSATSVSVLASGEIPYDVDDYAYVARTTAYPYKWCVPEDSPLTSMEDFIELAQSGEPVTVGGPYTGSLTHLSAARFADLVGFDLNWVPFDGGPAVDAALLGGQVDIGFYACRPDGLRNLALTSAERTTFDPDVPTLTELGHDFEAYQWLGFVVKAGTDPSIISQIEDLVIESTEDPAVVELNESQETEVSVMTSGEFTEQVREDLTITEQVREDLGLSQ